MTFIVGDTGYNLKLDSMLGTLYVGLLVLVSTSITALIILS